MKTIFEKNNSELTCFKAPEINKDCLESIPEELKRKDAPNLPELSEVELIRHYIKLSKRNFGVDNNFYPLGSCTMKYNPKINEQLSRLNGFTHIHPLAYTEYLQPCLKILFESQKMFSFISGMDDFCMQPSAGAHGELTGIMIMKAYHTKKGNLHKNKIIIPDSAHGTNPASAALCGYKIISIKSNAQGLVDINELKNALKNDDIAGLMLTNPNTLGLFEKEILTIAKLIHEEDGLLYYDGANLNAIMGKCKPGDMGFDIIHINLHKTFSTPHGGGGPGAGPIGVKKHLIDFMPVPRICFDKEKYYFDNNYKDSIGRMTSFYGNFLVILRAYIYIRLLGKDGLKSVSETAVLNANYLMSKLKKYYDLPYDAATCMHEFVLSGKKQVQNGVHTKDIAKRLIDKGYHPPTVYFPLIVDEAIMIEPTETESKETLDKFIETMIEIAKECEQDKEKVLSAPLSTPVKRLDETLAARKPILRWHAS